MNDNRQKIAVSVSATDVLFGLIVALCVGMFTWNALFPLVYGGVNVVLPSFIAFMMGALFPMASAMVAGTMSSLGLAVFR